MKAINLIVASFLLTILSFVFLNGCSTKAPSLVTQELIKGNNEGKTHIQKMLGLCNE